MLVLKTLIHQNYRPNHGFGRHHDVTGRQPRYSVCTRILFRIISLKGCSNKNMSLKLNLHFLLLALEPFFKNFCTFVCKNVLFLPTKISREKLQTNI